MDPKVDAYIRRSEKWPEEMTHLRTILLSCELTESIKWGKPCYSHEAKNIIILQEMNEFLALMFFKGALLHDCEGVLEEQGPNSRSARRIRFKSVGEVYRLSTPSSHTSTKPSVWRKRAKRWNRHPSSRWSQSFREV